MRPTVILRAVVLAAALTAGAPASVADACSCLRPEAPQVELGKSAAVFEAKVTEIAEDTSGEGMQRRVTLAVDRAWKGVTSPTVEVLTAESSAACGFNFEPGKGYLIYASDHEGQLHVGLCSRSQPIEQASADLADLGAPSYPAGGAPAPPNDPAPVPAAPIAPPPPPPPPREGRGCAGCAAAPIPSPRGGAVGAFVLAIFLGRRRRVVS